MRKTDGIEREESRCFRVGCHRCFFQNMPFGIYGNPSPCAIIRSMKRIVLKIAAILYLAAALRGCEEYHDNGEEHYEPKLPNTPTNLRVEYSVGTATLSWKAVDEKYSYRLYRSNSAEGPYTVITDAYGNITGWGISKTSYSIIGLPIKTPYYYKVSTLDNYSLESELSEYIMVSQPDLRHPPKNVRAAYRTDPDRARVTWDEEPDVETYGVYRDSELAGTTSELFYDDEGVSFGSYHSYTVASVTDDGAGPQSSASYNARIRTRPAAPIASAEVSSTTSRGSIHVSWDAVTGADRYRVYRSNSENGPYAEIQTATTQFQYFDTNSVRDTLYYYRVIAINTSGDSDPSSPVPMISRTPPDGLTATFKISTNTSSLVGDTIKVDWNVYTDATEYKVYRREDPYLNWTYLGTSSTETYTDTYTGYFPGIYPGTNYNYRVAAVVDGFESEQSENSNTVLTRPGAPTNVSVLDGLIMQTVTWSSVKGATGYRVNGTSTGSATIYTIAKITDGYYYAVEAYNSSGTGPSTIVQKY